MLITSDQSLYALWPSFEQRDEEEPRCRDPCRTTAANLVCRMFHTDDVCMLCVLGDGENDSVLAVAVALATVKHRPCATHPACSSDCSGEKGASMGRAGV
jgi:hypothetical protein